MTIQYNFDEVIDRTQTESAKWTINKQLFGREDVLPMWVADMDFKAPEPVLRAIMTRTEHGIFGYASRPDSHYQSVIDWLRNRFNWETQKSWQITTPGVVPAISVAIHAFTHPGDKVVIQPPVYHPFFSLVQNNGRQVVENTLVNENGFYRMDFDLLDRQLADPRVRMLILCSPHNPVGRVWTRDELLELGSICLKHNTLVVSDEIHSDLVYSWAKQIPFASLSPELASRSITLIAPSKTFNLAGFHTSLALLSNPELFTRFGQVMQNLGIGGSSVLGLVAMDAAYRQGEEWLEQLLDYLEGNINFMLDFFSARIPQISVRRPEGTYLAWLDCRRLGLTHEELCSFMIHKAGLGLDEGAKFGKPGEGYMRINLACPHSLLQKAFEQLEAAVNSLPQ